MQSVDLAPKKLIDETIRLYSNLLDWNPTERQLSKPTFNLIHDLVRRVVAEFRILRDVFLPADLLPLAPNHSSTSQPRQTTQTKKTGTQLNNTQYSKKTWDRRERGEFVQKLVDYVAQNGQTIAQPCSAAKIAAGLEPVKANELLQALAKTIIAKRRGSSGSTSTQRKISSSLQQENADNTGSTLSPQTSTVTQRPSTYTRRNSNLNANKSGGSPTDGDKKQQTSHRDIARSNNADKSSPIRQDRKSSNAQQASTTARKSSSNKSSIDRNKDFNNNNNDFENSNQNQSLQVNRSPGKKTDQPTELDGESFNMIGNNLNKLADQLESMERIGDQLRLKLEQRLMIRSESDMQATM